jgi:hypothetical protein
MKRFMAACFSLTVFIVLPLLLLTSAFPGQMAGSALAGEVPDPKKIDRWVADLGSGEFEVREKATRELEKLVDVPAALKKALEATDPEVRKRAADVVEAIRRNRAGQMVEKAARFATDGRVDEFVEILVRLQGLDDEKKGWAAATALAGKLVDFDDHEFGFCGLKKGDGFPAGDFADYLKAARPKEVDLPYKFNQERNFYLLRGETIEVPVEIRGSIVVASKSAKLTWATGSVIFCGGSVEADRLTKCIVVCDGTFKSHGEVMSSLVIARGPIVLAPRPGGVFLTQMELVFPKSCSLGGAARTGPKAIPGCVHFFDSADVGLKVSTQVREGGLLPTGVRVTEIEKDSPFAKAGLQAEDVVTKVSGEEIPQADYNPRELVFNRLLRRRLAIGEEVTLTVRRGDRAIELTVPPKD